MVSLDNGNQYGEEVTLQTCPTCGKPIKQGKRKKKFCSERCQHLVNQRNRRSGYMYAQRINSILLKNRNILKRITTKHNKKASKLMEAFSFIRLSSELFYSRLLQLAIIGGVIFFCGSCLCTIILVLIL